MNITAHFDKYSFHLQHKAYNTFYGQRYNIYEPLLENFNASYSETVIEGESTFTAFAFMRKSTIRSFFVAQQVDIPICFKKSKSHYSPTFEVPLLKTLNILMRSGLHDKMLNALTSSFSKVFHRMSNILSPNGYLHWRLLHYVTECFFIGTDSSFSNLKLDAKALGLSDEEVKNGGLSIWSDHKLNDEYITYNNESTMQHLLFESLQDYAPIFSFYIRKVDKSVRKNSRGKSKKYTIIWKYIPSYKRLYVTIRWLLKDLRFQKLRYLEPRLVKILEVFLLSPDLSFLSRVRGFVHGFVFKNFKKTLLNHLKSVS